MRLCNNSITVYNSYTDPTTKYKVYLPTTITGVSWFSDLQVAVSSEGLMSANEYIVRIPVNADFSNKSFLSPKEFDKIPNDEMINYWTLKEGDRIVLGAISDTGDSAKPANLEAKYDEVLTIISVTDNRRAPNAKHWKVVGK